MTTYTKADVKDFWNRNVCQTEFINGVESGSKEFFEEAENVTEIYAGSGCGFGSSDFTFSVKAYIDDLIGAEGAYDDLKTIFDPCLKVVKK